MPPSNTQEREQTDTAGLKGRLATRGVPLYRSFRAGAECRAAASAAIARRPATPTRADRFDHRTRFLGNSTPTDFFGAIEEGKKFAICGSTKCKRNVSRNMELVTSLERAKTLVTIDSAQQPNALHKAATKN